VTELLSPAYRPSFVLYEINNRLLGYIIGQAVACEGELLRIAVDPSARRCGVASTLINALLTALKNEGCSVCFLDVRESNLAAKNLYTLHGFESFDRRRLYYRQPTEDAIVMKLTLEP
jgi:ribosomal-protein-alanine N-acetyltransferase